MRCLAHLVVPLEYGSTVSEMVSLGGGTLHHLLRKLIIDCAIDDEPSGDENAQATSAGAETVRMLRR